MGKKQKPKKTFKSNLAINISPIFLSSLFAFYHGLVSSSFFQPNMILAFRTYDANFSQSSQEKTVDRTTILVLRKQSYLAKGITWNKETIR